MRIFIEISSTFVPNAQALFRIFVSKFKETTWKSWPKRFFQSKQ